MPPDPPLVGPKGENLLETFEEQDATLKATYPETDNQPPH